MPRAPLPISPTSPGAASGALDQPICDARFDAVMHGRTKPGTKLREEALCAQFDVGRTAVRQALRRLAESEIVLDRAEQGGDGRSRRSGP